MKDSIEETKAMLESHYYFIDSNTMFADVKDELADIVIHQLAMPKEEAYKFVCNWFDNRK